MRDHPIIFSAPMVQALLGGRKTMTRRLLWRKASMKHSSLSRTPWARVQPGDRLWVRENVKMFSTGHDCEIEYCDKALMATGPNTGEIPDAALVSYFRFVDRAARAGPEKEWTTSIPSIHMPRWVSRLTLIVTATKIERLQSISYDDTLAEGAPAIRAPGGPEPHIVPTDANGTGCTGKSLRAWFHFDIWNALHGAESWDANPEVVALSFRVIAANIDQPEARAA